MSVADFAPLWDAIGTDVTYYIRQLGARNSETGWPAITWSAGTTVSVIMYPISKRNDGTPDTRGVTEQRWYVLCQSKLEKDNRIKKGSDNFIIDTEKAPQTINGVDVVYECEAILEVFAGTSTASSPSGGSGVTADTVEYPYNCMIWVNGSTYYSMNGQTGIITSGTDAADLINASLTALTVGRANPERVMLKGAFTITDPITVSDYTVLDLTEASISLDSGGNCNMIELTGYYITVMGGILDGNKDFQASGSCIRVSAGTQRFYLTDIIIRNAKDYGVYIAGTGASPNDVGVGTFKGLEIENCGNHGFFSGAWSGDQVLTGCNSGGNGGSGFLFSASDSNIINACLGWNNASKGFDLFDANNNIISSCRADWNTEWGIFLGGTSSGNLIKNNKVYSNVTGQIRDESTGNYISGNVGYATENSGTGSITSGGTSDVITHGCAYTPTAVDITVTLTENPSNTPGAIWVDTIGATEFTVNCENDPGASNLDFAWAVRRTP